jgi:hypothetical protein
MSPQPRKLFPNIKAYYIILYYIHCLCGQSSWLQIQRSGFDTRSNHIFWVVGLERGPLSLVSTNEELLERKSSGFGLEKAENAAVGIRQAGHVALSIRKSWH